MNQAVKIGKDLLMQIVFVFLILFLGFFILHQVKLHVKGLAPIAATIEKHVQAN